ncbi:enoyl-CoA hydratase/isomerase family protein [Sphingobium sp. HBC34]|uniref:Enoyl-CoA hydratase/isomerase family protein n=1 Tax=Sphingobium cyanobacteriorum TaxID=3063954 RepID=A0ABT8ZPG9_9SPHN|nr:enoyl-CoA hydratase/isomerase family protein [Sphingobium sp. HBC34]MDO7836429.1 enoyl-CoA hydratase/isomerase family protein [Sphingobium sp. HBC34]
MTNEASPGQVTVERVDAIAIVRFANPPHGTMAAKGAAQLRDALARAIADEAVHAIIVTGGQDGVFIRHADVSQIAKAGEYLATGQIDPAAFAQSPFNDVAAMLEAARKPVIAAINGVCMGGGLELALACTIRIAAQDVKAIGLPEIRIDIFPGAGGIARLAAIIGMQKARLMSLRGTVLDAHEAFQAGIVDEVAPDALYGAMKVARELAGRAPAAIRAIMALAADRTPLEGSSLALARLLRDEPAVRERLRRFLADGEWLDQIS